SRARAVARGRLNDRPGGGSKRSDALDDAPSAPMKKRDSSYIVEVVQNGHSRGSRVTGTALDISFRHENVRAGTRGAPGVHLVVRRSYRLRPPARLPEARERGDRRRHA